MSDPVPRLTPRSEGAVADAELLRVALTDIAIMAPSSDASLTGRIRALLARLTRSEADAT
ncbi:MAG TPA: hypothetical protein VLQ79_12925 [Myxococcaceae bacterium]|nr:hypothetical protein [Myxococcaceae bacterium]